MKNKTQKSEKSLRIEGKYVSVSYENDDIKIILWNGQVFTPLSDLAIDENIEMENLRQSKLYVLYANAYALAVLQRYEVETELKLFEAKLDEVVRERLKAEGEKLTETLVKRHIYSSPDYIELQNKLDKYSAIVVFLKEILNSFVHKKEALFHFSTSTRMLTKAQLEELKRSFEREFLPQNKKEEEVW